MYKNILWKIRAFHEQIGIFESDNLANVDARSTAPISNRAANFIAYSGRHIRVPQRLKGFRGLACLTHNKRLACIPELGVIALVARSKGAAKMIEY
jgi:hypothetical protein